MMMMRRRLRWGRNTIHVQSFQALWTYRGRALFSTDTIKRPSSPLTFVTIPASNYCEKARWALQQALVPFVEEKHIPVVSFLSTVPKGGRTVPLLYFPDQKENNSLIDSSDILDYCATFDSSLYPNQQVKDLELFLDRSFGPHIRKCAYFLLFQNQKATKDIFLSPLPKGIEASASRIFLPIVKQIIINGLKVDEERAERSWNKVEKVLEDIEQKLGDTPIGTRFLCGQSFSAADITFCSHMSLLLFPKQNTYLASKIELESIQDPFFRQRLAKVQQSKAGQFVYWCYQHKRPAFPTDTI